MFHSNWKHSLKDDSKHEHNNIKTPIVYSDCSGKLVASHSVEMTKLMKADQD